MNVVLTTLCVAFYMMIPPGSFDSWFSTAQQLIRMAAPESYDRLVENTRKTFVYHEANPPERALYLWHPHGLLSMTPFIHSFYAHHSRVACLPMFHRIPVIRDLYAYARAIPSDYATMKETLEHESVSVVPGGVREMMLENDPEVLRLVLQNRTGVFRMALETGTPMVPVLTYGETELFPPMDSPMLRTLNQWLYKHARVILPIPSFTSLLNWLQLAETPLPPVRTYAGPPISVSHVPHPTDAQIAELRARYVRHLRRLFRQTAPKGLRLAVE